MNEFLKSAIGRIAPPVLGVLCLTFGCQTLSPPGGIPVPKGPDPSIDYADSNNPLIVNGTAYDLTTLKTVGIDSLRVPAGTLVFRNDVDDDTLTILMKKKQGIAAHPPDEILIDRNREKMGCVIFTEAGTMHLAPFGCFELPGHGSVSMQLEIRCDSRIKIVERESSVNTRTLRGDPTTLRSLDAPQ